MLLNLRSDAVCISCMVLLMFLSTSAQAGYDGCCRKITVKPPVLSKCETERAKALELQNTPMVGVFVPQCEANGDFSPLQLYASTGYSWCVDQDGNKIPGTETARGLPPPNCGLSPDPPLPDPDMSKCLAERANALQQEEQGIIGVFVPECDNNGDYAPFQRSASSGYAWCVDLQGNTIPGTETPPYESPPNCAPPDGGFQIDPQ